MRRVGRVVRIRYLAAQVAAVRLVVWGLVLRSIGVFRGVRVVG